MMLIVAMVLEFLDLNAIHDLKHQLRTPIEAFFHWNPELLGRLSAPILVRKLLQNIYFKLELEFGPKRIRDLASVCLKSMI
jgi:hypothetical protein